MNWANVTALINYSLYLVDCLILLSHFRHKVSVVHVNITRITATFDQHLKQTHEFGSLSTTISWGYNETFGDAKDGTTRWEPPETRSVERSLDFMEGYKHAYMQYVGRSRIITNNIVCLYVIPDQIKPAGNSPRPVKHLGNIQQYNCCPVN